MGPKLRHLITGAMLALAGVAGAPQVSFHAGVSVLLLLGGFLALALCRAPQRP